MLTSQSYKHHIKQKVTRKNSDNNSLKNHEVTEGNN
jgi:hypothetical protein